MKYPAQAYCTTCSVSLDAKLNTQGAADAARAMFYRQHPAETCEVRNGVMPKRAVADGAKTPSRGRKRALQYDDDEYQGR